MFVDGRPDVSNHFPGGLDGKPMGHLLDAIVLIACRSSFMCCKETCIANVGAGNVSELL